MFTAAQRVEQAAKTLDKTYDELSFFSKVGAHVMGLAHALVEVPVSLIRQAWTISKTLVVTLVDTVVNTVRAVPVLFSRTREEEALTAIKPFAGLEERMAILQGKTEPGRFTSQLGWPAKIWGCISAGVRTGVDVVVALTSSLFSIATCCLGDLLRVPSVLSGSMSYQYTAGVIKAMSRLNPESFDVALSLLGHQDCPPDDRYSMLRTDAAGFTAFMSEYEARAKVQPAQGKVGGAAERSGALQPGTAPAGA